MRNRNTSLSVAAAFLWLVTLADAVAAQAPEPILYMVRFPEPAKNYAAIETVVPASRHAAIELMMPIWTPGFYHVVDYAANVKDLTARTTDGVFLKVERPGKNRWRVQTDGASKVIVKYELICKARSVIGNWVGDDMLILNGGSAFLTLADKIKRPHEVRLELATTWKQSMTALDAAPSGKPHHYLAPDYDTLVDCPILAGSLAINDFKVDGSRHFVVAGGDIGQWDGTRAAEQLKKIVEQNHRMWGFLPFKRYIFLFAVQDKGAGGLEHANSALMFSNPAVTRGDKPNVGWLNFVSHEYFHAFNVKRLRPVELGPFDYENAPRTTGLWIAEGLTTYFGDLLVARAGFGGSKGWLGQVSSHIDKLQKSPGRLVQTLEQASADVWTTSMSGVGGNAKTISYYVKGPVIGFVLDAKIQRATNGDKSLDDVMKLAYKRYGGEKGFTADEFCRTAGEIAGIDLEEAFHKWLATTEELDYTEALDWFGLRFQATPEGTQKTWRLEIRDDAAPQQRARLEARLK